MSRRAVAGGLVVAAAAAGAALAAPGDTDLVVNARGTGSLGAADALDPAISADGRYVAFESDSPRLHPEDRDSLHDVFVVDMTARRPVLVSRASGAKGIKGDEGSGDASISANGRLVAFDGARDIGVSRPYSFAVLYVRDLRAATTRIVSRASGTRGALANGPSSDPRISGNGRIVVFGSEATNLDRADRLQREDVYARDLRTNRTILVSRASGARGRHTNRRSHGAAVSADGRHVAFQTRARGYAPGDDDDGERDVFLRDLLTGRTRLVSPGAGVAGQASVSGDGRYVAFVYEGAGDLDPADGDRTRDVYVRDMRTGEVELVSRARGGSDEPEISDDGRFVAYESKATGLDPADTDPDFDVYVYDRLTGTTILASRASGAGPKATSRDDPYAGSPDLSGDGRFVAFESDATNLHPDDVDEGSDIFRRDIGPLDALSGG